MKTTRSRWARWAGRLVRLREWLPLTNLGLTVLLGGVLAYVLFGVPRADYVVQLVAVLSVSLVVISLLVVVIAALMTHYAVKRAQRESVTHGASVFEATRGFTELLRIPRWRWFPLLQLHWDWERPQGFRLTQRIVDSELRERVESDRRCRAEEIRRRFVVEDGFGLARIVLRRREKRSLRVLPFKGQLEGAPLLRSLAGGEDLAHPAGRPLGDRVDMRRYVAGDPLRLALWKLYARTGQLMVRTPERALSPALRVVAYLPSCVGDEAAAAAALVAVERDLLGPEWVFAADGAEGPTSEADRAIEMICASREVRGTSTGDAAGLATFLARVTEAEPARLLVFGPGRSGPWLDRVCAVLRSHRGLASVVVAVDGVREGASRTTTERLLFLPPDEADDREAFATAEELDSVVRTLERAGARVTAVDRGSGRILGTAGPARSAA